MATEISQNFLAINMKRSSSMITPGGSQARRLTYARSTKRKKANYSKLDKSRTTGQRAAGLFKFSGEGPFPNKLATTLLYRSVPIQQVGSGAAGTYLLQVALNDLFDFDYSNVLQNKQPLFYDQLFSATGPYQRLECKSWRTRITVINTGAEPLSVYWNGKGTTVGVSEEDTLAEVTNRAYMQQFHLGAKGQEGDRVLIKSSGKWADHNTDNIGVVQAWNANVGTPVYGSLFCNTPTNATAPTLTIQIDHYFDIVCVRADAITS